MCLLSILNNNAGTETSVGEELLKHATQTGQMHHDFLRTLGLPSYFVFSPKKNEHFYFEPATLNDQHDKHCRTFLDSILMYITCLKNPPPHVNQRVMSIQLNERI